MNWISVKDQLPTPPANRHHEMRHLITDGHRVYESSFVYWPPWTWILPHGMESVTHWMPLPEPPNDK